MEWLWKAPTSLSCDRFICAMKLFIQFFALIAILTSPAYCQKEDYVWIFGDSTGIDFNPSSGPIAIESEITGQHENYASISNSNGRLLFYLHGGDYFFDVMYSNIRNRDEIVIENGDSILSNWTTNQSLMLLSFSSDSSIYYLVHIAESFLPQQSGFYYSSIELNHDGIQAKVTQKNQVLIDSAIAERMHAVRHANGDDWWVLVHSRLSNTFTRFHLSSVGFIGSLNQDIGTVYSNHCDWIGEMNFSPNGKKMAVLGFNGFLDIFDFERCSLQLIR